MARTKFKNDVTITGSLTVDGTQTFTGATTLTGAVAATGEVSSVVGFKATVGTATATAGAATLAARQGKITTEALTTAQDALYTLTITNSLVVAGDMVLVSVANGTNTQGTTVVKSAVCGSSSIVIVIANKHGSAQALNGTLVVSFLVVKAI